MLSIDSEFEILMDDSSFIETRLNFIKFEVAQNFLALEFVEFLGWLGQYVALSSTLRSE